MPSLRCAAAAALPCPGSPSCRGCVTRPRPLRAPCPQPRPGQRRLAAGMDGRAPHSVLPALCRAGGRDSRTASAAFYRGSPPGGCSAIGVQPRLGWAGGQAGLGVGGSQDPSVFRSIDTSRSRGGPSPRRWCHLHLIRCSALASDKRIAEE